VVWVTGWLGSGLIAHAGPAAATDAAADCVAVIESRAESLVERARNGDGTARTALRAELENAAVLIGDQYIAGARDEDAARARLERSRKVQQSWPEERRAALHRQCSQTAAAMLGSANRLERFFVRRVAAKRMERMLAPGHRAAASAPTVSNRASEPQRR
jgi:hypothetical protein